MMNQEFITFTLSRDMICYVAAYVQDAAAKAAMAKALLSAADDAEDVAVTIHEAQVVTVYSALVNVPAGIGAAANQVLKDMIAPYLQTNPRMAGMIDEVQARSRAAYEQVVQNGSKELERIIHLLGIN